MTRITGPDDVDREVQRLRNSWNPPAEDGAVEVEQVEPDQIVHADEEPEDDHTHDVFTDDLDGD